MKGNILKIIPFLVLTIVVIAAVELLYRFGGDYLFPPDSPTPSSSIPQARVSKEVKKSNDYIDYRVILERDLFKPFSEKAGGESEKEELSLEGLQASKLDLVLMGTVVGQDNEHRAIILDKKKGKQEIYNKGDYVQGAEIKRIIRGKVVLGYQGRDEILDMSEAASIRRSQQPVQPAASPVASRTRLLSAPRTSPAAAPQPRRRVISPVAQPEEVPPPEEEVEVSPEEESLPEEGGVPEEQVQDETVPEEGGAPVPAE